MKYYTALEKRGRGRGRMRGGREEGDAGGHEEESKNLMRIKQSL